MNLESSPKLCECGCGEPAPLATQTNRAYGHVEGEAVRFIVGHNLRRTLIIDPPNPSGLCQCGCGQKTKLAKGSSRRNGTAREHPTRFLHGHNSREQTGWIETKYRILPNGCWEWTGTINEYGYGMFGDNLAHRAMWERKIGSPAPPQLDHLCHDRTTCAGGKGCSHRRCVNPDHLQPALPAINSQRGCKTKLTPDQVRAIRADARTQTAIAAIYGLSVGYVSRLKAGYTWRNLL